MFYNEIFRHIELASFGGLPRVKRDPGKFRQDESRADVPFLDLDHIVNFEGHRKTGPSGAPQVTVYLIPIKYTVTRIRAANR